MSIQKETPLITIDTPFVTINELARRTGLSTSSIRRLREKGFIQAEKESGEKKIVLINLLDLVYRAAQSSETLTEFLNNATKRKR